MTSHHSGGPVTFGRHAARKKVAGIGPSWGIVPSISDGKTEHRLAGLPAGVTVTSHRDDRGGDAARLLTGLADRVASVTICQ